MNRMNTTTNEKSSAVHPFELAGLGKAPYVFTGVTESVFQAAPGEPARAGSSCDFCPASIRWCFWLRSADGKKFKVGCDCIRKSGDTKLIKVADVADRKLKLDATHAREDAIIASGKAAIETLAGKAKVSSHLHPTAFCANQGLTLLDWARWMFQHAGRSGQLRAAKRVLHVMK